MAGGWAPKNLAAKNDTNSRDETEELDKWDPMREDYNCPIFNSHRPMNMTDAIRRLSDMPNRGNSSNQNNNSSSNDVGVQLYIRNIPHKFINKTQLTEIFNTAGEVINTKLITSNPDLPYSFGFITYNTEIEAVTAMKRFNGKNLDPEKQLKPLVVAISSSSKGLNQDSSPENPPKIPFKRQDPSTSSNLSSPVVRTKCECCGKPEIKFRCDKCSKVGYCSGKCLAKDEVTHESVCGISNGIGEGLKKSTSIFSKNLLMNTENSNKPMPNKSPIMKMNVNNTNQENPISNNVNQERPVLNLNKPIEIKPIPNGSNNPPKIVASNCPDASMKKFVRIPQNEVASLVVTHIEKPNKFYCVINNTTVEEKMHDFNDFLNATKLEPVVGAPKVGALVVAPFEECLYRAVIISTSLNQSNSSNLENTMVNVLFVDFGNKEQIPFSSLKTCFNESFLNFQYQAIECSFKNVNHFNQKALSDGDDFTAKVVGLDGRTHMLSLDLESPPSPEKSVVNIHPSKVFNSTFNSTNVESAITPLAVASTIKNSQNSLNNISLIVGREYRFKPTNINGLNFYVNLADNFSKSLLITVEQYLNVDACKRFVGSDSDDATISVNTPCIYLLCDGSAHRGRILYSIQDGSYLVFDVDTGNKSVVTVDNLYHLSELYSQVAEQSILCTGDKTCRDKIKSLIKNNQEALLKVVSVERTPVLKYTVDLVSTFETSSLLPRRSFSPVRNTKIAESINSLTEDLISLTVDDKQSVSEFKMEVMEYPNNLLNLIQIPSRHLTAGSEFDVLISHFNNPNDFFVHLFENGCTSDLNVITLRLVNDFSSSGCQKRTPLSFDKDQPFIPQGTPIVAFDNEDHLYYRSELLTNVSSTDEKFEVLSIDFGKTFVAAIDKCYIADHTLCIYPKVAVRCCLQNNDETNENVDLQLLYENNNQTVFTLKFTQLNPDGKYSVQVNAICA